MTKRRQLWLLFRAHVLRDWEAMHDIAAYYASAASDGLLPHEYYGKAFRYYERGAKKGNPACQYDFGFMLIVGDAGIQDNERGLTWIKKSAEGGYLAANDFLADYPH